VSPSGALSPRAARSADRNPIAHGDMGLLISPGQSYMCRHGRTRLRPRPRGRLGSPLTPLSERVGRALSLSPELPGPGLLARRPKDDPQDLPHALGCPLVARSGQGGVSTVAPCVPKRARRLLPPGHVRSITDAHPERAYGRGDEDCSEKANCTSPRAAVGTESLPHSQAKPARAPCEATSQRTSKPWLCGANACPRP